MLTFLKVLGVVFLMLLVAAGIGINATIGWRPILGPRVRALTDRKFEVTRARLTRGAYLAEHVAGCIDCHSPSANGPNGPENNAEKKGAGQIFPVEGMPGTVVASNLTPDKETGAGTWSDDQLARGIREGIGHDGRALFPVMPYPHFRHMSDEDLASVVVYLRALPAIRNSLPATKIISPVKYFIRSVPEPVTEAVQADVSSPVKRGKYLVDMAACGDCHTPMKRGRPVAGMEFAGGQVSAGPWGKIASSNITPDASGMGNYTQAAFFRLMRTGYVDTRQINTLMPWQSFGGQTQEDLEAEFAFLKTLAPVRHNVDNGKGPTLCKKCGLVHGAGEMN